MKNFTSNAITDILAGAAAGAVIRTLYAAVIVLLFLHTYIGLPFDHRL